MSVAWPQATGWQESHLGGSRDSEDRLFQRYRNDIAKVQARLQRQQRAAAPHRAFHAKMVAGLAGELVVQPDVPAELRAGPFRPGARHRALVRLSNASGVPRPDGEGDLRGAAVRVLMDGGGVLDLLLTNAPASHARDARQFMTAAKAGASRWKLVSLARLLVGLGPRETVRMLGVLRRDRRVVGSLVTEQFWSRAPFAFGDQAVKYALQPMQGAGEAIARGASEDHLRQDLVSRLHQGPVSFWLAVQPYVDATATPIEDGSVQWRESDSPFLTIATLVIPAQDLESPDAARTEADVEALAFTPWNTPAGIRPLGSLNRARRPVYEASAAYRGAATTLTA